MTSIGPMIFLYSSWFASIYSKLNFVRSYLVFFLIISFFVWCKLALFTREFIHIYEEKIWVQSTFRVLYLIFLISDVQVKVHLKEYMQPPLYGHWFCRLPVLSASIIRLPVHPASAKVFSTLLWCCENSCMPTVASMLQLPQPIGSLSVLLFSLHFCLLC